ncbi:complex iii assembly factor lyrm7 [Plakobranchus ocellatus]|uniref:Complex III assembly factor LYRM7 n=1 Tax=Plakobranchus ocellatus TaxID=259542 RepID=A0AAV4B905_9GAST|nr:complex iii assembly factor lyrm7 [Plakobranchus ocellatus]
MPDTGFTSKGIRMWKAESDDDGQHDIMSKRKTITEYASFFCIAKSSRVISVLSTSIWFDHMAHQRTRVLAALRELHRTRRVVFEGDNHALKVTRAQIREEFRKNASETNSSKVEEAITLALDVAKLLRTTVVQCKQKEHGSDTFELRLTKDTVLLENTAFDPAAELPERPRRGKCQDSPTVTSNSDTLKQS